MTETGGDRAAMSRALGAAFLNHQVEQLEKSVVNRGPSSGNWRDRRPGQGERNAKPAAQSNAGRGGYIKRAAATPTVKPAKKKIEEKATKMESKPKRKIAENAKDADVIIIDTSVLIYALGQLKKWCKQERKEIIIVPLEALNTLDLLKKGTSGLSQRARAASRILEAQVGTNPRICVQRDDAFVSWEDITFKSTPAPNPLMGTPEWLRRTISCATWEVNHHGAESSEGSDVENHNVPKKVVFAVVSQDAHLAPSSDEPVSASPVPLPTPHANKFEPRTTGTLVAYWAARAGVDLYEVQPIAGDVADSGRKSEEDDNGVRSKKHHSGHGPRGRGGSHNVGDRPSSGGSATVGLVERPPAVMAMMEMVAQPSRVVRVLARGEKLDPET